MDSFNQAVASLQLSFESIAKLSTIIPLWMMMVMADKYFLGIPLLEGSVWRSPRLPPRFTVEAKGHEEGVSQSVSAEDSEPPGFNSCEPEFAEFTDTTTHFGPQIQQSLLLSASIPLHTDVTALTLYRPSEIHGRCACPSQWYESIYLTLSLFVVLVILFTGLIFDFPFRKRQASKALEPQLPLLTVTAPILCWELIYDLPMHVDGSTSENDGPKESEMPLVGDEYQKTNSGMEEGMHTNEERVEDPAVDVTVEEDNEKGATHEESRDFGYEAAEEDRKEDQEDGDKADEEGEGSELGMKEGSDAFDGSPDLEKGTGKKKKKRPRPNAKTRARKRAQAGEDTEGHGDTPTVSPQDQVQPEDRGQKPGEVAPEVAKPDVSDTTKGKAKGKAPIGDPEATGRHGGYSLKETDLHDATFVTADKSNKTSVTSPPPHHPAVSRTKENRAPMGLPPRPAAPQGKETPMPVGLPLKPQVTGIPTNKGNATSQSSLSPGAKPFQSKSNEPVAPKREVPPLLPHHQSFMAGQRSANVPHTSSSSSKPVFGNLSGSSFFGFQCPDPPMFANLPPGLFSNEAFKLPVGSGEISEDKRSAADTGNATPLGQRSIFHNVPMASGTFTGFGNSSPGGG